MPRMTTWALLTSLVTASPLDFLGRRLEDAASCVESNTPCMDGKDCCGVCAYIGAETWQCLDCTAADDECIPMGNRCCNGGNKRKDEVLADAQFTCQGTGTISELYGIQKYTCQAAGPKPAEEAASPAAPEPALKEAEVEVTILQRGDATERQAEDLKSYSKFCFESYPVDTEGGMGLSKATDCVVDYFLGVYRYKPVLSGSGSYTGSDISAKLAGATVIMVKTPSGEWEMVFRMEK
ncbi:unnamed protein product [Effrenium voratum]|nr:unnamed protein product [Effrenium voratum]